MNCKENVVSLSEKSWFENKMSLGLVNGEEIE